MKIGFLTAIREDPQFPIESFYKRITAPLGTLYLAGYLEKYGFKGEIYIKDTLEELMDLQPEVLGISAVTENIEFARTCAKRAADTWDPIILLGGPHITAIPRSLPKEFQVGVVGEGEETLLELLNRWQSNLELDEKMLSQIPGIVFHQKETVYQTEYREGVSQLDQIPIPPREKYIKSNGFTYMMTSRGCPYTCSFCTIPMTSRGYRMHSPDYVVEEIKNIKKSFPHVHHIRFFDDLYIVHRKRIDQIADRVAGEGLNQDIFYSCWGRAHLIDADMIRIFKKMNMRYVAFGAESGSSRVLSKIKPGASLEDNQRAIDLMVANDIGVACSLILGHPLETEEDLWATYDFLEKNFEKIKEVELNVAVPWPGTALWAEGQKDGSLSEDMDFNRLRKVEFFPFFSTDHYTYINKRISPERFERIVHHFKKLYLKFFNRNRDQANIEKFATDLDVAHMF